MHDKSTCIQKVILLNICITGGEYRRFGDSAVFESVERVYGALFKEATLRSSIAIEIL